MLLTKTVYCSRLYSTYTKNCPLWTFTSYIPSVSFSIAWKLSGGLLSEKEQLSHKLKDCTQELWRVADHPNTFQRNPKIPVVYFMKIELNMIYSTVSKWQAPKVGMSIFLAISLSEMKDLLLWSLGILKTVKTSLTNLDLKLFISNKSNCIGSGNTLFFFLPSWTWVFDLFCSEIYDWSFQGPNVWWIKNRTKLSSVLLHQTLQVY